MNLANEHEYARTKEKLAGVQETISRIESAPLTGSPSARSASLRSLRAYANQLIEELIRYETRHGYPASVRSKAVTK